MKHLEKNCNVCGKQKTKKEFYKNRRICKECYNKNKIHNPEYYSEYYKKNQTYTICKNCGKKFKKLKKASNRIYCKDCRKMIKEKWQMRNINRTVVCVC